MGRLRNLALSSLVLFSGCASLSNGYERLNNSQMIHGAREEGKDLLGDAAEFTGRGVALGLNTGGFVAGRYSGVWGKVSGRLYHVGDRVESGSIGLNNYLSPKDKSKAGVPGINYYETAPPVPSEVLPPPLPRR